MIDIKGIKTGYGNQIVTDGLVLHLDAANPQSYDGNSVYWRDLSGNATNGTLINGVGYNGGNKGNLVFDGVNDYVQINNSLTYISTDKSFSISIWCNLTSFVNSYPTTILLKTNTSNGYILAFSNQSVYSGILFGSSSGWVNLRSSIVPSISTWYNIVLTYNGNNPTISTNFNLYTNNVNQNLTASGPYNTSAQVNYIGTAGRVQDNWIGSIPVVKIYNKKLNQQEITQNFNALRSRYGI